LGICEAKVMTARWVAERVVRQTSQARAVFCTQVPMSEIAWPSKKRRKLL
jgi:hypothetical protein